MRHPCKALDQGRKELESGLRKETERNRLAIFALFREHLTVPLRFDRNRGRLASGEVRGVAVCLPPLVSRPGLSRCWVDKRLIVLRPRPTLN